MKLTHFKESDWITKYSRWIIRWRWAVVIVSILLAVVMASGGRFLGFDTDYRVFFSEDNPQLQAFDAIEKIYTKNENVLFALEPLNGNVFEKDFLTMIEDLTKEAWKVPYAIRVDSLTNFQHTRAEEDDLVVEDLFENAAQMTEQEIGERKQIATSEPFLKNRLVSSSGHSAGVNVTLQIPDKNETAAFEVAAYVRDVAKQFEAKYGNVKIHLTGVAMLNNSFSESGMRDMQTLVPLMYLVIFIFIGILLRSFSSTISAVFVITMAIFSGMGMAGWLGIKLTPPSASAATMIMTLGVADSIHVLSTIMELLRKGASKENAMIEALRLNIAPVFLTSVTTCIGFLSMNFSDAPPFHDLGNIVTMGVIAAFFFSTFFMPAFVMILPFNPKKGVRKIRVGLDRFAEMIIRNKRHALIGSLIVVTALAYFIPRNELNDEFVKYFDKTTSFRADTDYATQNLTGIYTMDFDLKTDEPNGICNPEYLKTLDRFATWYRKQPGVIHVNAFTDIMKRLNKNMHNDDLVWYRVPKDRDLAAQYLLLYEFSLPYGLDLNNQVNVDKSATRFTVTMGDVSAKILRETAERGEAWLEQNAPEGMRTHAAGTALMFAYISERNIQSMLLASFIAFMIIGVTLMFVFRSFKFGALSLIPNLTPAIMGFGIWGLFVGKINMGLAVVTGMTLGIVVDDTIHFMSKYLRARREQQLSSEDAVRYTFSTVGMALFTTTVVLVAGFYILTLSSFYMNSGMGKLSALTIACALIADFFFLPAVLMRIDSKNKESSS